MHHVSSLDGLTAPVGWGAPVWEKVLVEDWVCPIRSDDVEATVSVVDFVIGNEMVRELSVRQKLANGVGFGFRMRRDLEARIAIAVGDTDYADCFSFVSFPQATEALKNFLLAVDGHRCLVRCKFHKSASVVDGRILREALRALTRSETHFVWGLL